MMKMSTKGRYGLRLMIDIAINGENTPVSLKDIALRQEISEKYLEQIIIKLSRAGLVRGVRGAHGGYMLGHAAKEISAGDILRVVEGGLAPVDCVRQGEESMCSRAEFCVTIDLWRDIKEAVESVVDNKTLEELVKLYYEKNKCNSGK